MGRKPDRVFNSRKYQGQIERNLIIGGILITLVLGGGLIWLIWGRATFVAAMTAFAVVLGVIVLIALLLKGLELITRE